MAVKWAREKFCSERWIWSSDLETRSWPVVEKRGGWTQEEQEKLVDSRWWLRSSHSASYCASPLSKVRTIMSHHLLPHLQLSSLNESRQGRWFSLGAWKLASRAYKRSWWAADQISGRARDFSTWYSSKLPTAGRQAHDRLNLEKISRIINNEAGRRFGLPSC